MGFSPLINVEKSIPLTNTNLRRKLRTNFQRHWSIRISQKTKQGGNWSTRTSPEIHMDQWLPNLSESSGLHRYRSIECSSLKWGVTTKSDKTKLLQGRKSIHHHRGNPPFFLFQGLRLYGVYPSFRTYGVYPFPLFSQENGIHHSFFCSVVLGVGRQTEKGGVPRWWCILVFPLFCQQLNCRWVVLLLKPLENHHLQKCRLSPILLRPMLWLSYCDLSRSPKNQANL